MIIDEIQKVPKLLDEIKKIIDEKREQWLKNNKSRELLYILTGSNRFELQEGISDSLAGRCGVVEMASFTMAEKYGYESNVFHPDLDVLYGIERSERKYKTRKEVFVDISTHISKKIS